MKQFLQKLVAVLTIWTTLFEKGISGPKQNKLVS